MPNHAWCDLPDASCHTVPGDNSPRSKCWSLAMGDGSGLKGLPNMAMSNQSKIQPAPRVAIRWERKAFTLCKFGLSIVVWKRFPKETTNPSWPASRMAVEMAGSTPDATKLAKDEATQTIAPRA